jgi:hypothetical protein
MCKVNEVLAASNTFWKLRANFKCFVWHSYVHVTLQVLQVYVFVCARIISGCYKPASRQVAQQPCKGRWHRSLSREAAEPGDVVLVIEQRVSKRSGAA